MKLKNSITEITKNTEKPTIKSLANKIFENAIQEYTRKTGGNNVLTKKNIVDLLEEKIEE